MNVIQLYLVIERNVNLAYMYVLIFRVESKVYIFIK